MTHNSITGNKSLLIGAFSKETPLSSQDKKKKKIPEASVLFLLFHILCIHGIHCHERAEWFLCSETETLL